MLLIPEYSKAEHTGQKKEAVFAIAESIAKSLNYESGGDIETVVEKIGGKIHYLNLNDWFTTQEASIWVHGVNNFEIFLSNFSGPLRNRFSIAHELGHYFLHSQEGKVPLIAARSESNPTEWEANWFAAAFLMPADVFQEIRKKYGNDLDYVAAHFLVSHKAADVRLKSLSGS